MLNSLIKELESLADSNQAQNLQRFFKTGKGEYGEGDIFLGIKVPVQRQVAKKYNSLNLKDIQTLLNSKIHEHRMVSLFILISKYKEANKNQEEKEKIFNFYLKNTKNINNWDLVDLSAPNIPGSFFLENKENSKIKSILYSLANSSHLWEKRISIISTFAFIREKQFEDAIKLAEILLKDNHDLIHKAVGWMLREIGKKDLQVLEAFLNKHHKNMPRTMLRYAIEKLEDAKRKDYLKR